MVTLDALIERDGTVCVWCGREPWRRDLTAEHLMPRSRGGRTSPENLTVACRPCNKRRGTRPVVAFARAQIDAGAPVRTEVLSDTLARLSDSDRRDLAGYGQRQHGLLQRLLAELHPRLPGAVDARQTVSG
jgi:hypothetical protein